MNYEISVNATLLKTETFDFNNVKYYKLRIMDQGDIMDIGVKSEPKLIAEIDNLSQNEQYTFILAITTDRQFKPKVQVIGIK